MISKQRGQVSISDVARLAGVSLGTVSNVLNNPDRVKTATLERVNQAIESLGFVRNEAARQLKAGRSSALGLLVLDTTNPFFADLARGAEDSAVSAGFQVLVGNSNHDKGREANFLRMFQEQRLSGIMLSPIDSGLEQLMGLREMGTQVVLVDQKADEAVCCSVTVDDIAGGHLAASHLLQTGRRRLAFIGGSLEIHQVADRLAGAQKAVAEFGEGASLRIYTAKHQDVISGREIGLRILRESPADRPEGIFAANDLLAVGLLQAFAIQNSIGVPKEIAIVGYDDIDFAQAAVVPLSSIRQPAALMGSTALELLADEISNPDGHRHRQVIFQPELVVRQSS